MDRTLVISATNVLAAGFLVVPTDRKSPAGDPVNGLFAVARAIHRVLQFKVPARAVAVIGSNAPSSSWPPLLQAQQPALPAMLRARLPTSRMSWRRTCKRRATPATTRS
jgi:hypothetical protein